MISESVIPYKKPYQKVKYSKEQLLELARASSDLEYFCEKFVYVQHSKHGKVPLELYPYQKDMIKNLVKYRNIIMLTGRQLGKCLKYNSKIRLRNKKTKEIIVIEIGKFFDHIKKLNGNM